MQQLKVIALALSTLTSVPMMVSGWSKASSATATRKSLKSTFQDLAQTDSPQEVRSKLRLHSPRRNCRIRRFATAGDRTRRR